MKVRKNYVKRFITAGCVCLGMVAAISSTTLAFNYDWEAADVEEQSRIEKVINSDNPS